MRSMLTDVPVKRGPIFRPRLLILLIIIFGSLLVLYSVLELSASKREQIHIMNEQAVALITAMQKSSDNAIRSFDLIEELLAEKLLSMVRLLEQLDSRGGLTEAELDRIAEENHIFRINVFDRQGNRVMSNDAPGREAGMGLGPGPGRGPGRNLGENSRLFDLLNNQNTDELVIGFKQTRFGTGNRFAVAKKRRKGGAIVLNINASEMLNFRKAIGIGRLLRDVGESEGIEYVILQDSTGILLASSGVDSLSAMEDDPFLLNAVVAEGPITRFTRFQNKQVYEVVKASEPGVKQVMRIGLSTRHLEEAVANTRLRLLIASLLFLVVGVLATNWLIGSQNYTLLQKAYTRIESYTGSILTHMDEAVIAVDSHSRITLVNKAMESLFGIRASEVLGQACQAKLPQLCDYLTPVLTSGTDVHHSTLTLRILNRDHIVDMSINVVKQPENDIIFAVIRDVTRQKQLEANLARREKITAMGHLASGVAHEIRNPLNAISMIAQRFKSEFRPETDREEYDRLSHTMIDETRRINDIIQQFLQFTKPAGLNRERFPVEDLFRDVDMLLRPEAEGQSVSLGIDTSPDLYVFADRDKLKQVLLNLVQNAIQASKSGGRVSLAARDTGENLEWKVTDTGVGIPPENMDKIFNMYFTTREEGTGLGLSIVQQIITQHDGTLDVQSGPGVGTTITIILPKGE